MIRTSLPFKRRRTIAAAALVVLLAACAKQPLPIDAAPRPVKVETIADTSATVTESFVGTLRARQRSDLSFESPGRIAAILVDVGDRVRAGQELARLEDSPARWRLDRAEAERTAASAALAERATQLKQNEALAKDQIISATALESVQTQHRLAMSQLQAADAALALARRDLALSRITAPFDGEVVARLGQPHTDTAAGQPILQIEAGKALEVVAMLPDGAAVHMAPGQVATAALANGASNDRRLPVKLERISSRSESGSLVQAIFRLDGEPTGLRSGSVVSVELPRANTSPLSVPAAALLPASEKNTAGVYLLDPAKGRIARRDIKLGHGVLPGGRIPVAAGLAAGDQVVIAGTAFLSDGQAAVKHDPQTLLGGAQP